MLLIEEPELASRETALDVRVFRTTAQLETLRNVWKLCPGNPDSDFDVFLNVVRSRPEVIRPHVIVVYRNGRPDAMLVGRLEHTRLNFRVGYLHLRPRARLLYFVYGGPRGNTSFENCELLIREIQRSLALGEADAGYLNFIRVDRPLYHLARSIPGPITRDYTCPAHPHFSARLPDTPGEYYASLPAATRGQAKSKAKRFHNSFQGAVTIRCFRDPCDIDTLASHAEGIATKSYQRALQVGFSDCSEMRQHLRIKAESGSLLAYVLYTAGKPAAFWIGDVQQQTFRSDFNAFDEDLAKFSPGTHLMLKVIEDFCGDQERRITEVDFATGFAQYKADLSNNKWCEAPVFIFRLSIGGLKLKLIRSSIVCAEHALKFALERTGTLSRLKRRWRSHAKHNAAKA